MTGIRGTYGYLIGDCGLPSGRGLVEGCEACVVVPEEDDRYKGNLRLSDRGLWSPLWKGTYGYLIGDWVSPLWKGTCRGLRGVCCGPRRG